jgi:hypothetical protein
MSKSFIFISCGQFTPAEKALGKAIVQMVKDVTGLRAFFAEEVQDLNGLDYNILAALRDCTALITVMHPRGTIIRPGGSQQVRASVWIEQEIAIATYIQRLEKRALPIIAFKHKAVGREGIRDLLHLNPIEFEDESEVLAQLPARLLPWRNLPQTGTRVEIKTTKSGLREGHWIRTLSITLINENSRRLNDIECDVWLPMGLLSHWSSSYMAETRCNRPGYRCFHFPIDGNSLSAAPNNLSNPITIDYCVDCGQEYSGVMIADAAVEVTFYTDEHSYTATKTVKELCQESEIPRL